MQVIRKYRPRIVLTNAPYDRHPDHGRAAKLVEEAFFKAGLKMIPTQDDQGNPQEAYRPEKLYHFIQSVSLEPDLLVDISEAIDQKMEAIKAFRSQFHDPNSTEPDTYISSPSFMEMLTARSREFGHRLQVPHAEGFIQPQSLGVKDLFQLI
jgi:bacillithiol biosynthesis deacetylase BshB1